MIFLTKEEIENIKKESDEREGHEQSMFMVEDEIHQKSLYRGSEIINSLRIGIPWHMTYAEKPDLYLHIDEYDSEDGERVTYKTSDPVLLFILNDEDDGFHIRIAYLFENEKGEVSWSPTDGGKIISLENGIAWAYINYPNIAMVIKNEQTK